MSKSFCSLGLMSGTSGDGVDASIIQSDGDTIYKVILDKYFKYNQNIDKKIHILKDKINSSKDLKKYSKQIKKLEKDITLFHANVVNQIIKKSKTDISLIGFHGQTIYHNTKEKISKQLGDGTLLSKLTKKSVVYNFRENDLKNGGEGAPLTPIFHKLIALQNNMKLPCVFLNLGGIANWTYVLKKNNDVVLHSSDAGPANCLIDQWIKKKYKKDYDKDGAIAKVGSVNKTILNKEIKNYMDKYTLKENKKDFFSYLKNKSYDVKDFNFSFVKSLSPEDGAATLIEYTSFIISKFINAIPNEQKIIVCGGGRKNKFLVKRISKKTKYQLRSIDNYGINGDFVESQAFAYLAIRSQLKLPISFPKTTGVKKPCTGGVIIKY